MKWRTFFLTFLTYEVTKHCVYGKDSGKYLISTKDGSKYQMEISNGNDGNKLKNSLNHEKISKGMDSGSENVPTPPFCI